MARTKASLRKQTVGRAMRGGAKLNMRQKREVKQLIGRSHEEKYIDDYVNYATGVTTSGSALSQLALPAQGTGVSQRVGDSIKIKRIELQYTLAGGDAYNNIRVIVFKWNVDTSVASPSLSSVLFTTNVGPHIAPYAFDNIKSREVQIVYDKTHSLSWGGQQSGTSSTGLQTQTHKVKLFGKKLHSKKVELDSGATTGYGIYYIQFVSDSAITPNPSYGFNARTFYEDA